MDRTAALLPWHGAGDVGRLSPVEVSARYLAHVRSAWDARYPEHPLAEQDFVLTLPASFDEVARELTVKAAALAGLPRVVLIEEPQAAFYAWIYAHSENWDQLVQPGQKILVCDIGGGTSDFTLIHVRRGEGGKVQFHRVAVGEHLILGGDNLDLALAHYLEQRLTATGTQVGKLEPRHWAMLVQTCRRLKETLLGADAPERLTVNLPWSGSRLIGGGRQLEVTREEVHDLLVEGFFPRVPLEAKPERRSSGFQEFGLPLRRRPGGDALPGRLLSAHRHAAMDEDRDAAGGPRSGPARRGALQRRAVSSPALRQRLLDVLQVGFAGGSGRVGSHWCWTTSGWTWPSPAGPPITAWSAAGRACGLPPAWPAPTTSAWNRGEKPSRRVYPGGWWAAAAGRDRAGPRRRPRPSGDSNCWSPSRSSFRSIFPARG